MANCNIAISFKFKRFINWDAEDLEVAWIFLWLGSSVRSRLLPACWSEVGAKVTFWCKKWRKFLSERRTWLVLLPHRFWKTAISLCHPISSFPSYTRNWIWRWLCSFVVNGLSSGYPIVLMVRSFRASVWQCSCSLHYWLSRKPTHQRMGKRVKSFCAM